jgi:methylated-DNA-[protein]-cysteine S-methyltransferase
MQTPIGVLELTASADGLRVVRFVDALLPATPGGADGLLRQAMDQLTAYFAGTRTAFDLPLTPQGTPFQQRVWTALQAIPYGQITSYGALADTLGDPKSVRAVAAANGANPLAILIPCHRVLAGDGKLTGYAGGLHRKEWLLRHEGALLV